MRIWDNHYSLPPNAKFSPGPTKLGFFLSPTRSCVPRSPLYPTDLTITGSSFSCHKNIHQSQLGDAQAEVLLHQRALVWESFVGGPGQGCDFRTGVPNLWDLMSDDLKWSWCNNNRNKVHNRCNAFESVQKHPPALVHGKTVFHKTGPCCQKGWGLLL